MSVNVMTSDARHWDAMPLVQDHHRKMWQSHDPHHPQAAPPPPQLHPRSSARGFEEPSMHALPHDSVTTCVVLPPSGALAARRPNHLIRTQTPPSPLSLSQRHGSVLSPHLRPRPHHPPSVSLVALSSSHSPTHSHSDTTSAILAVAVPRFCAPSAGGASLLSCASVLRPRPCPWSSPPALLSQTPTPHWHWHSHSDLDTTSAVLTFASPRPVVPCRAMLSGGLRSLSLSLSLVLRLGGRPARSYPGVSLPSSTGRLSLITGLTDCARLRPYCPGNDAPLPSPSPRMSRSPRESPASGPRSLAASRKGTLHHPSRFRLRPPSASPPRALAPSHRFAALRSPRSRCPRTHHTHRLRRRLRRCRAAWAARLRVPRWNPNSLAFLSARSYPCTPHRFASLGVRVLVARVPIIAIVFAGGDGAARRCGYDDPPVFPSPLAARVWIVDCVEVEARAAGGDGTAGATIRSSPLAVRLAARVPIMGGGGDVEMRAARGDGARGSSAAGARMGPDSLVFPSPRASLRIIKESASSLPAYRLWGYGGGGASRAAYSARTPFVLDTTIQSLRSLSSLSSVSTTSPNGTLPPTLPLPILAKPFDASHLGFLLGVGE
ncbi:hypothetical protein B0H13DRAFT_2335703 [Mycena leptocephala]|nr:hypothetical protein B0H13DRAFT_2335703 [Mycena leptocephala]